MFLVQILLPLRDNQGQPFSDADFRRVRSELTEEFGGVTAYLQSPAHGVWRDERSQTSHEDVFLVEVMTGRLDQAWWSDYRQKLEARFHQEQLVVRTHEVTLL